MGYRTETEILQIQAQNVFLLDKLFSLGNNIVEEVFDYLPGIFHTNSKEDLSIQRLNKAGEDWSQHTKDQMNEMGLEYFEKFSHPDTIKYVFPRFLKFYELGDDDKIHAEFQQLINPRTGEYETLFTVVKPYKDQDLLISSSNPISQLGEIAHKMERIAGEQIFVRKNFRSFQSLTKRELEILALISRGDTNKTISEKLFISLETVKQHRKRIKRKTECGDIVALVKYAQAFDII